MKKLFLFILIVLLGSFLLLSPLSSRAAAQQSPQIYLEPSSQPYPNTGIGSEVTFSVQIANAPNVVETMGFVLSYNEEVLEYTGHIGDLRGPLTQEFQALIINHPSAGILRIDGIDPARSITLGTSGELISLTFTVRTYGSTNIEIATLSGDISDWTPGPSVFGYGCCCGDANGNGQVTPQDALELFECFLETRPCGDCFDLNGDGRVTPNDALCAFYGGYLGDPAYLRECPAPPMEPIVLTMHGDQIAIDDQPIAAPGSTVTFTVSVNDAPNAVRAFGFGIRYDDSILEYMSCERGNLTSGFTFYGARRFSENILRVGGIMDPVTGNSIAEGSSDSIARLTFRVIARPTSPCSLQITNLKDDLAGGFLGWSTRSGYFGDRPVPAPVPVGSRPVLILILVTGIIAAAVILRKKRSASDKA